MADNLALVQAGRLWSAKNVYSLNAFLIQQCW